MTHYNNSFVLIAVEVHPTHLIEQRYACSDRFLPAKPPIRRAYNEILLQTPTLSVKTAILDHGIPCLGFALKERFHVNIIKERLRKHGMVVGPWLKTFKQALFDNPQLENPDAVFDVPTEGATAGSDQPTIKHWRLGDLAREIAMITPGQKIAYIADIIYRPLNAAKVVSLARDADVLFIEAAFLEKDRSGHNLKMAKCVRRQIRLWRRESLLALDLRSCHSTARRAAYPNPPDTLFLKTGCQEASH